MAKEYKLTAEGLKKVEDELEELKTVKRAQITETIKVALSFGDLSENSEYDEAKNEQAKVEARIAELEEMLKNVKIIDDKNINVKTVNIGTKVKLYDCEFEEEVEYTIVGSAESDPDNGMISDESPIGKAVIGASVGDTVKAETPAGELEFKVLAISR